ncbi:response regulator [Mesorhizobium sp. MSK_1335]|uniref:Response regulator n=1 Tax=Mesorhizobium montanum TaxID=3072323 RepID=A0ABU4ZQR7_9HYPH|nr:response regulator [Mesorhizobium sp. MSK_1335]MDX8526316.1 response regulator [Mesorhizobium sp. MSK_1335]
MPHRAILVVEDVFLIRMDLESSLEEAGFKVVSAPNAQLAIEIFDAGPSKIRGLVTDIRLGPGKLGWEIARYMRRSDPAMPVVYVSGDGAASWAEQGVPNSVMIAKPFAMTQITMALANLLNQQSPIHPGNVS